MFVPILTHCAEAGPGLPALRSKKSILLLFPELLDRVSGSVVQAVGSCCRRGMTRSDRSPASHHVWVQSCVAGALDTELAAGISLEEAQLSSWTQHCGSVKDPGDAPHPAGSWDLFEKHGILSEHPLDPCSHGAASLSPLLTMCWRCSHSSKPPVVISAAQRAGLNLLRPFSLLLGFPVFPCPQNQILNYLTISFAFFQEMGNFRLVEMGELLKPHGNSPSLVLWSPGSTFREAPSFAGVGRDRQPDRE